MLEKVQRVVTKTTRGKGTKLERERLVSMELLTVEVRRKKGDMKTMHKFLNRYDYKNTE